MRNISVTVDHVYVPFVLVRIRSYFLIHVLSLNMTDHRLFNTTGAISGAGTVYRCRVKFGVFCIVFCVSLLVFVFFLLAILMWKKVYRVMVINSININHLSESLSDLRLKASDDHFCILKLFSVQLVLNTFMRFLIYIFYLLK